MDSWGKVNLSLRILGRRQDGYHRLISLFWRIGPLESLSLGVRGQGDGDRLTVRGLAIQGPNILEKALELCRRSGWPVPWLELELEKRIPPGTGLGSGSGNAAALLRWLQSRGWCDQELASRVGADVPFLLKEAPLARVSGIGEILEPLEVDLPLRAVVALPVWPSLSAQAFAQLDRHYCDGWPLGAQEAEQEASKLLEKLQAGHFVGTLPNDFTPLLVRQHPEYQELFQAFRDQGALAWGISGSGSAAFGLWPGGDGRSFFFQRPWLERILIL